MVNLTFEKIYKDERSYEPCSIAIPFAKGECPSVDSLMVSREKHGFLTQSKVTSRWEDGSVRWAHLYFLANLPGNQQITYSVDHSTYPIENQKPIKVMKNEVNEWNVDNGIINFATATKQQGLFSHLTCDGITYEQKQLIGPSVTLKSIGQFDFQVEEWNILEEGPVCAILEGVGYHRFEDKELKATVRLTAYAQKPWIEVAYRIFNTTKEAITFDSIRYNVRLSKKANRTCVATSNYRTKYRISEEGEAMEHIVDAEELLYEANEHIAEVFYGTMFADATSSTHGVCATIYQAQQNYPKGIKADKNGVVISIIPENATKITMQSGMAREQRFLLHFHAGNTTLEEVNNRSLIYQMPDRPILAPSVYQNANVFPDVFVENKDAKVEIALIAKADSHSRCYGMLNWGDSPDPGYTSQGRGGGAPVWTNNEYDFPHACALMYAKTSTRRFLDYLLVTGRHWMDVDVCHYSDNPLLFEGQWEHTHHHVLDTAIVCSHQWVEGLLDYYHFTGDKEAYHTAIGIGHNILRLLETPMFQQKGEINARETGWAMRSLVALYVETHDESWLNRCDWIVGHFEQWEEQYGHWLSPYTDNTEIRVVFMISIAVGSLMRYYRIRPQQKIKDMILRAVDDVIENCYMDHGLFYYKELPSLKRLGNNTIILEALTIAYELTGNKEYLSYGKLTFEMAVRNYDAVLGGNKRIVEDSVIGSGPGTKNFAQSFFPLVTFYKAMNDN